MDLTSERRVVISFLEIVQMQMTQISSTLRQCRPCPFFLGEWVDAVFVSGMTDVHYNPKTFRAYLLTETDEVGQVSPVFVQYGLYRRSEEALSLGEELLRKELDAVRAAVGGHHGPRMIMLGVIGEILNTLTCVPFSGDDQYERLRRSLLAEAFPIVEYILERHYRRDPPAFWEESDPEGRPVPDGAGHIVVDPGHATECAGFLAELVPFLPDRDAVLEAALSIHLFADRVGFTPSGVMTKYADRDSGGILADTQAVGAGRRPTAPWWNVREHCAAALRLYTLVRDERLLTTYQRAQNASYLYYPNKNIGGQMVQTLDPSTLEVLDVAPATGNLDPMHDPRARIREIECLESLIGRPEHE